MGGMLRGASRSPSLAVAIIALVVALGGTSYAALKLPPNSVGASHIKSGAVGSSEVANRSLRLRDFAPGTRNALKGERGPQGLPGSGGGGPATVAQRSVAANVAIGEKSGATATCQPGERATGGGADIRGGDSALVESFPTPDGAGWFVNVENNNDTRNPGNPPGGPYPFTAFVVCVPAAG